MKLVEATLDDCQELASFIHNVFRGEHQGWTSDSHLVSGSRISAEMIEKDLNHPISVLLKCLDEEDNDKLIACIYGEMYPDQSWYIGMLSVCPTQQGKGLGGKLMTIMEDMGIEKGCKKLKILVSSPRRELISWYSRRGYVMNGQSEEFPETGCYGYPKFPMNLLWMEKEV